MTNQYIVAPTGRITWDDLAFHINIMSNEQKSTDVTIEVQGESTNECFAGELRICGDNHDSLDDWHPVIFVPAKEL